MAIIDDIQHFYGAASKLISCNHLDEVRPEADSTIFIIGENLGGFDRISAERVVFINFSVVCHLGGLREWSLRGWRLIKHKRRLLTQKLPFVDAILDYYPKQTNTLMHEIKRPVFGFVPYSQPNHLIENHPIYLPLQDRPFDVSFVGGISPRRAQIISQLKSHGVSFGPSSGGDVENISGQARVTLNLHKQRSGHLEIPRIAGGLAAQSIVVSEQAPGLFEVFDRCSVIPCTYENLTSEVLAILSDKTRQEEHCAQASAWYSNVYVPNSRQIFLESLEKIEALRTQ